MRLAAEDFMRRFLMSVLPRDFHNHQPPTSGSLASRPPSLVVWKIPKGLSMKRFWAFRSLYGAELDPGLGEIGPRSGRQGRERLLDEQQHPPQAAVQQATDELLPLPETFRAIPSGADPDPHAPLKVDVRLPSG